MVLPTTPFVKALVPWATGKRLTNRLLKLSLITDMLEPARTYNVLLILSASCFTVIYLLD